jgi:uncharacterized membrane protein YeaQ/YmgE (transglycosylase-associated protein family)
MADAKFAWRNINGLGNVAARRASERNGLPEEVDMFGLIGTIIVGFVVGVIAKLIMPGKENMGFIMTTLLGIVGSLAATYIGQAIGWYEAGQGAGWIGSIVGAFVVLWAYLKIKTNR